jgi:hypothetical protein
MVLQNKLDSSNGHALKSSNFRLNLSFGRCLSQKRTHFRENFLGNENFRENFCENENFRETKFRENLAIFASFSLFAKMEKTVFVSTLIIRMAIWEADCGGVGHVLSFGGSASSTAAAVNRALTPPACSCMNILIIIAMYVRIRLVINLDSNYICSRLLCPHCHLNN